MELGLNGSVVWIQGASSGLGLACAKAMAHEGANVAISSRGGERLDAAARAVTDSGEGTCLAVPLDVRDRAAAAAAHAAIESQLGPIDVVVMNGGGPAPGGISTISREDLEAAFELLCASAFDVTQIVLPLMRRRGSGTIIYLTSSSTREIIPNLLLSNMFRIAVAGMAKTIAKEVGADGVRVLCVAPGRIATERTRQLDDARAQHQGRSVAEVRRASLAGIPLGRYGEAEEFGQVVAFLASPRASYVTGTTVMVDGGKLDSIV